MEHEFSIVKNAYATASVALHKMYIVDADRSYDVKKTYTESNHVNIFRTWEGEGTVDIKGKGEVILCPGSVIFIKAADLKRYYCSGISWKFSWFEFTSGEIRDLKMGRIIESDIRPDEKKETYLILENLRQNDPGACYVSSAGLCRLIYTWLSGCIFDPGADPHKENIRCAIDYMRGNISTGVSVREMAAAARLGERRFREVFAGIVGQSPKKYIDEYRMDLAEELLKNTPFSVCDISERLGYSGQFHFSKAFKEKFGISPAKYRRSLDLY